MKLAEMRLLVRVADTGSMSRAARQLHVTPAAVSATIQRIEAALGMRLFERTTRSLHPTEEGLVVIEGCRDMTTLWQRTLDDAVGQRRELRGTVRLSAPADTTYAVLSDVMTELVQRHPELRLVFDTSDAVQHIHRDAIDIAIRYGALEDSTLAAHKLLETPTVLVASPEYLERRGRPETPDALRDHRCLTLQLGGAPEMVWKLRRGERVDSVPLDSPLCGDGYLARQWAVRGLGVVRKSLFDVIDDLEAGQLELVLPGYTAGSLPIHAVFPGRRFRTARVRAVRDAIHTGFSARAARCETWLAGQVAS